MKMDKMLALTGEPPQDDSEDFSAEEAKRAMPTSSPEDLVQRLMKQVRGSRVSKFTLKSHELRRHDGHLYYRVRMIANQEPDKILIFCVDWVQP